MKTLTKALAAAVVACGFASAARAGTTSVNFESSADKSIKKLGSFSGTATYDDAADYNGYTDNTTSGIKTLSGTTINLGDNATYTRTAAFEYRATPNGAAAGTGEFGMATVTVASNGGMSTQLQRLMSATVVKR